MECGQIAPHCGLAVSAPKVVNKYDTPELNRCDPSPRYVV